MHPPQKKYIVTGATSGIGLALSKKLLDAKAIVIGIGREASKVRFLSQEFPDTFSFLPFDLNNVDELEPFFDQQINSFGKFDGLVLCAGIEESKPLSLYTVEKVKALFNINVFANIEIIRIFSKKKYSNDGSSIVVLSSVMGELGEVGKIGYCSTKAALLGLIKSAALELSKRKIRVNAVSPAIVYTPLTEKLFTEVSLEKKQEIINRHPNGIGRVEDIVPGIEFLLSDGSQWITGQNIKIDGGYSII